MKYGSKLPITKKKEKKTLDRLAIVVTSEHNFTMLLHKNKWYIFEPQNKQHVQTVWRFTLFSINFASLIFDFCGIIEFECIKFRDFKGNFDLKTVTNNLS